LILFLFSLQLESSCDIMPTQDKARRTPAAQSRVNPKTRAETAHRHI
jgi:hypothetical protein